MTEQLRRWRASRPPERTTGRVSSGARYEVDGLRVLWRIAPSREHRAWGVRYERDAERHELVGADLMRLQWSGLNVQADDLRLVPPLHPGPILVCGLAPLNRSGSRGGGAGSRCGATRT